MCYAHLVLAQAGGGLSSFLMPRVLNDGTLNAYASSARRRSWATGAPYPPKGASSWRAGDEGRGVAAILEMVTPTRLDCMLGSAAQMRQALGQALHRTRQRSDAQRPAYTAPAYSPRAG